MSLTPQPIQGMSIDPTNPLARGLVGYWPMVEGTGEKVADYSGHQNHGTMQNMDPATDWVAGKHGKALDFDGVNQYVDASSVSNPSSAISFACWVRTNATPANFDAIAGNNATNWASGWALSYDGSGLRFWVNVWSDNYATVSLTTGVWNFLCGTWDGAVVDLYLDGIAGTSGTYSDALENHSSFRIGSTDGSLSRAYPGTITNAMLFDRALPPSEIATLHADPWALFRRKVVIPTEEPPPPPEPSDVIVVNQRVQPIRGMSIDKTNPLARGLVGYWPMLEGTGETVADYSGQNNHGAMVDMDPATDWVAGKHGKALEFDGVDSHVSVPESDTTNLSGALSFGFWMRPSEWQTWKAPLMKYAHFGVGGFGILLGASPTLRLYRDTIHTEWTANIGANDWSFLFAVLDGTQSVVYQDGVPLGSPKDQASSINTASFPLYFGISDGTSFPYGGELGGVTLFNRALAPLEIATLHADPWALFRRTIVIPTEQPPAYDIQGSNAYGSDQISFNWTVNPA